MRKVLSLLACAGLALALTAGASHAAVDLSKNMSLGWWDSSVPVGLQIGLGPKMALNVGVGFNKPDEGDTGFNIGAALPIVLFNMDDKATFSIRPGFIYGTNPSPGLDNVLQIQGHLEARVWLSEHFSLLAGHGINIDNSSPTVGDSQTQIYTTAISATDVGFWYRFK